MASAGVHPADLAAILKELPEGTVWCAGGIGRAQLPAATLGLLFRDGARIGLEDNLRLPGGSPATNPDLVERFVQFGRLLGREPMSAQELRAAARPCRRSRRDQESVTARATRSTSRSDSDGESGRLSVRLPKRSAAGRAPGR